MPKLRTNKGKANEAVTEGSSQRRMLSVQALPSVSEIRTATMMDQEFTVIPCVALVQGVLWPANAEAPELALADEFGRFPAGWNGRPVVLNHPRIDDTPVSANAPSVLEEFAVGQLFNTVLDGTKLKTEIWINNARISALGGEFEETVERLKSGDEVVEVSTGLFTVNEMTDGEYDGQEYSAIWRNIVPDHLALLSKGLTGACSVKDGCGAPRVNEGEERMKPVMRAAMLRENCSCQDAVVVDNDTPNGEQQEGMFKRLMDAAGELLTFRDQSENVSDGDIRTALYAALNLQDPSGYCYIIAVFHGSDDSGTFVYEEGYTGALYQRTFALQDDGGVALGDSLTPVRPQTQFVPVSITENASGADEGGEDAPEESSSHGKRKRKKQEKTMTKKELVQSLIDNEGTKFTKDDSKWLEGLDEEQLQKLETTLTAAVSKEEEEEEEEELPTAAQAPVSTEDFVKSAPEEIRSVLNEALKMQRQRKDSLITGLKANKRNRFSEDQLKSKSLEELENLAELAQVDVNYEALGAGGDNLRDNEDENTIPSAPLVFPKKAAESA